MRRVTVYDTRTRESRLFVPLTPPKVGLFVCGLTPYDEAHIGHGRTAVIFDVVARALRRWGYRVLYIQNVTNIDDRLIARGAEQGVDPLKLADRHFQAWRDDMTALGVRSVNYYPYATDYMPEILEQIATLLAKGFAYTTQGSVYYDVAKFPSYGALSGQRIEMARTGTRIESEPGKRASEDFALWKAARPGEPSWESPWGPGRPGWHIEDTAITVRLLGARYDLHGGGIDLKFPHHEAEIAQAEAATGAAPLVNFWMHAGMLNLRGEKMSKSLGNIISLHATLERVGPEVLRFYYLNAHYRQPLDFVEGKSLEEAREAYARLEQAARRLSEARGAATGEDGEGAELPERLAREAGEAVERLDASLSEDFNTREAIATLFGWARTLGERMPELGDLGPGALAELAAPFDWAREVLGLFGGGGTGAGDGPLGPAIEVALAARARARGRGDFAEADRIRAELLDAGIVVEDEGGRSTWRKAPPRIA